MDCSMPGFPVLHQLPELAQAHVHWVSDALQPSHPLSSPSPAALDLSQHQGLWPKYWSFSFNISSSNEYSSLISFRTDWFDLTTNFGKFLKRWEYQMWSHTCIQISERTHSLSSLRTWRGDFSLYTFLYFWFLNHEMKSIKNLKNNWKRERKKKNPPQCILCWGLACQAQWG